LNTLLPFEHGRSQPGPTAHEVSISAGAVCACRLVTVRTFAQAGACDRSDQGRRTCRVACERQAGTADGQCPSLWWGSHESPHITSFRPRPGGRQREKRGTAPRGHARRVSAWERLGSSRPRARCPSVSRRMDASEANDGHRG
jgi:hypothetical protein